MTSPTSPAPRGRTRALLSAGVLLGIGAFCTAATLTGSAPVLTHVDGRTNYVALQTAAADVTAELPAWPSEAENASFTLDLGGDRMLTPGASHTFRMAVRNASPRLAADLTLSIVPPESETAEGRNARRLFDALEFTVREGHTVLVDHVGGSRAADLIRGLPGTVASGGVRQLEIDVRLPDDAGDDLHDLRTPVQLAFTGMSAVPAR
ncbi:hypothetical protein [Leifsonia aquatica]|uniref:hypothetical protein n=1 Tax=Leifsonia aquatica TaxID=144185 RepID=UPI003826E23F